MVRFTLAFTLLSYGFAKLFPLQFAATPSLYALNETYGESSPMRLLWNFMSAFQPCTFFSGFVESAAGALLLFRRTATLGALVAAPVLLNVVLLNFCYDVPVKLYSFHLLFMSLFLLLPEVQSFWCFFVQGRAAQLRGVFVPPWERRSLRTARIVLQGFVILFVLGANFYRGFTASREHESLADQKLPLKGIWYVDHPSESTGWQCLLVTDNRYAFVRRIDGSMTHFRTRYDMRNHSVDFYTGSAVADGELSFRQPDNRTLLLNGSFWEQPFTLTLHRRDEKALLLTHRGFHWVNEYPFNR